MLGYDPHQPEVAVIVQWNSGLDATLPPLPDTGGGDAKSLKQRGIEEWENEGGELKDQ